MSHTKGPWHYSDETRRVYHVDKNTGEEPPICEMDVNDWNAIESSDEVDANARLIAAAPDLLAALDALGQACANEWGPRFRESTVGKKALAALAKARGES
jgi:hypothetical protein